MAFETLFIDGFDHYATADIGKKWPAVNGTPEISSAVARNGGQALLTNAAGDYAGISLGGEYATVVFGFALYYPALPTGSSFAYMLSLYNNGNSHIGFQFNGSGSLEVWANTNTTAYTTNIGGTSTSFRTLLATTPIIPTASFTYVEVRVYIHATAGELEIRFNGETVVNLTGINTKHPNSGMTPEVDAFYIGGSGNVSFYYDDLYIRGDTVLTAGGFLGDVKVVTVAPQANGTYAQLTPTGAASNFEAVDDATPDGDTTYVAGQSGKDSYDLAPLNITGIIHAAQWNVLAKKSDAGERSLKHFTKSGATEQAGSLKALSTEYRYQSKVYETDPNTGASWTVADLDAAEFGQEIF